MPNTTASSPNGYRPRSPTTRPATASWSATLEAGATDPEAEAEAEAEWADNWDSADSHAYMDRVEAGLEPEVEP